jgi:uncharacterized repeat protein (TIGR01451 family)
MPTRPPGSPTLDLTLAGSFGSIDDLVFETFLAQPAGTGNFNTFEQIQHNGVEQGYNTDGAKQFDTKTTANFNHSVLLAQVPIVIGDGTNGTQDGVSYRQFLLDINEPGGANSFLSLDKLQIWQEEAGNLTGFTPGAGFSGTHTNNLVYDLDAGGDKWIGLNSALSSGSGRSDLAVLIPDSFFINDGVDRFVYLYSEFGVQSGWDAGGGFEEWGLTTPNGPNAPTNAMSISKTASVPGGTADHAGEVITYAIKVSDVGNTNLTNVVVSDPSTSDLTRNADIVGNNDNVLNPGEIWSFTAHHTVTRQDIDNSADSAELTNIATARSDQTAPITAVASVPVVALPELTATKVPSIADGVADSAGEVITYTFTLTNNGNASLTEPNVFDLSISPSPTGLVDPVLVGGFNIGDTNQDGVMQIGEAWQFAGTYTLTQADIDNRDAGGIPTVDPALSHDNTAFFFTNQTDPHPVSASVPIVQKPHVSLAKAASVADGTADHAGDVINYTIALANDGNMDLTSPAVSDPFVSNLAPVLAGGFNAGDANMDGELSVGETWQYTASHTLTQAEIDNGGVVDPALALSNTASASTHQGASATATASVPVVQNPHVTLAKAASVADGTADAAGDVINYTIALTNDGNMTLTAPAVTDPFVSDLAPVVAGGFNTGDTNHDGKLGLGEIWQYTATHTVTQAEIDNGGVVDPALAISNTASASTAQSASATATASVPVVQNPDLTIAKMADIASVDAADDVIHYTVTVANAGNMTLTGITVSDPFVTDLTFVSGDTNSDGKLDLTETWTYAGSHTVTQGEMDAGGSINNTATADSAQTSPETASASVAVEQNPAMTLTKVGTVVDSNLDGITDAGDTINYTFTEKNTGNVTLHDVQVTDETTTVTGSLIASLAPGASDSTTWSASYTILQFDINQGFVDNEAVGNSTTTNATATSHVPLRPHMTLTGTATDANPTPAAGDSLVYDFSLTNDGNVTLHAPTVSDTATAGLTVAQSGPNIVGDANNNLLFDVGETWTFAGTRTLSADDIANGVPDTAIATASGLQNQHASATTSLVFPT